MRVARSVGRLGGLCPSGRFFMRQPSLIRVPVHFLLRPINYNEHCSNCLTRAGKKSQKVVKLCENADRAFEQVQRARFVRRRPYGKQTVAPNVALLLIRARYYDPQTGEFTSRDPLEYVDGMSLYRAYFVPGSVDPSGLQIATYTSYGGIWFWYPDKLTWKLDDSELAKIADLEAIKHNAVRMIELLENQLYSGSDCGCSNQEIENAISDLKDLVWHSIEYQFAIREWQPVGKFTGLPAPRPASGAVIPFPFDEYENGTPALLRYTRIFSRGAETGAHVAIFNELGFETASCIGKILSSRGLAAAGESAKRFLGKDYRVVTNKAGDRIFMSKDGLRKIRFDFNATQGDLPHAHLEILKNGRWRDAIPGTHRIYPK